MQLLLADYDQQTLVGFDAGVDTDHPIDGPIVGLAYREERIVEERTSAGRRGLMPGQGLGGAGRCARRDR